MSISPSKPRHVPSLVRSETQLLVERTIQRWREQAATFTPVKRGLRKRDRVSLKVVGTYRDDARGWVRRIFDHQINGYRVMVEGFDSVTEGFDQKIIGATAGTERRFTLRLPHTYFEKNIAGGLVEFVVSVDQVEEPKVPDLDDAFARRFGSATMSDLRTKMYDQYISEAGF